MGFFLLKQAPNNRGLFLCPQGAERGGQALTDEMKALNDQMMNVRLDIRELSTKVDGLKDVKKEVEAANDLAKEALQYAKSGQHQINELKDGQKWLWRAVGTAIITGVFGGVFAILWKALG